MSNRIELVQADTAIFRVSIIDPDGVPIDLSKFADILFTIKRSRGDSDVAAIFAGSKNTNDIVIVTPPPNGLIDVTIDKADSANMRPGKPYYWDCKLVDNLGTGPNPPTAIFTVATGTVFADGTILQSPA